MKRSTCAVAGFSTCVLLMCSAQAHCADLAQNTSEAIGARIIVTRLDVNDHTLELHFRIKNSSNHNIWICADIATYHSVDFEAYMRTDNHTLVISRRFDVLTTVEWNEPPVGRYVRIRPGEDRPESLSLELPVHTRWLFLAEEVGRGDYASRLLLEIGFYDEDLPGLIRSVLAVAEKFSGDIRSAGSHIARYFPGLMFKTWFGSPSSFDEKHQREIADGQLTIDYTWHMRIGEQVLQAQINGVSIPYENPEWLSPNSVDATTIPGGTTRVSP